MGPLTRRSPAATVLQNSPCKDGETVAPIARYLLLCAVTTPAVLSGCQGAASDDLYARLQDDDPAVRAAAIVDAAHSRDPRAVALLVDRLGDPDAAVRLAAFLALKDVTGQTLGYEYYGPLRERLAAIERWRAWLRTEGGVSASPQPAGGVGP